MPINTHLHGSIIIQRNKVFLFCGLRLNMLQLFSFFPGNLIQTTLNWSLYETHAAHHGAMSCVKNSF